MLLISTGSRLSPGFALVDRGVLEALRKLPLAIEIEAENINILRLPEKRFQRILREYLIQRYEKRPPDVIILAYVGNLGAAAESLQQLFPGTPVIAAGFTEERIRPDQFGSHVRGLAQRIDPRATLELMLGLQPETRRIIVIGGTAEVDRQVIGRVKEAARSFPAYIEFDFWDNRALTELRQAVAALPPRTAILFARMFRDGAGQDVISTEAGRSIAQWANVPVYAMTDTILGTGAVGGSVANIEAFGRQAGELARLILTGTPAASLPFEIRTQTVPMFDWRALKRWGISETRLPPDSIVRYRQLPIWEQYRGYVFGALILITIQAAIIWDLLLQRRRRRRAESGLSESQRFIDLAVQAGGIGLWVRDAGQDDLWTNAQMRSIFGFGQQEALSIDGIVARIHPDDRLLVRSLVEQSQDTGAPFEVEFRAAATPAISERWIAARGQVLRGPRGRISRAMGTVIDISGRKVAEARLRESEDNFRRLVESTAAVMWQADIESWVFTYVSPQAVNLLGYPLEQWHEKDFWASHIHPEDKERALDTCFRMSQTEQEFDFEYRMIRASGEVVWIHDLVNCQRGDGKPMQLRGLMIDITERKHMEQALRESEARFRTMANGAPVMIWMMDRDRLCTFFNNRWFEFTGRRPEQEFGNGWTEGLHAEDLDRFLEICGNAFDAQREFAMECRLRRYDGEYRWVLCQALPRCAPGGEFLGYIASSVDITERKGSEERFRMAIEGSPNAILLVDAGGRVLLANAQVEKLFGYSRDELLGQSVEMLVAEYFQASHPAQRAGFLATPQARPMGIGREVFARRKDGSEVPVEIGLSPLQTNEGAVTLATIVDITERKRAAEALEKERAFLRQVIDVDPNFIFAKDREGRFTLANRAIADAYGTSVDGVIGKTDADFNPNREEVEFFRRMDLEVIDTLQERFIPEEHVTDARGNVRWLQTVKRPIIDADGTARQVLGASSDITRRRETEMQLKAQRLELAHVARISTMGELAASLAHELNQPLTAILSNAQAALRFLAGKPVDLEEVRDILQDITADDNRAGEVVRRIRALVKKEEPEFAALDVVRLMHEVVELVRSDAIMHHVRVSLESENDLPPVVGDRVQLQQVVLNLILNAFDAMNDCPESDRKATLQAGLDGGKLIRVAVRDRGTGLSGDTMDKIFQPFYTTKPNGLGMGLSICRSIVEAHGGHLWAENNPGRGATFYFTIPAEGRKQSSVYEVRKQ